MTQFEERKNRISKENASEVLKAFAKEYRKRNGETPIEIVIVGGGSILLNYGFREMTQDFDVMINHMSDFDEIVHKIADEYNLVEDWMNTDFTKTSSYSDKLRQISRHFCSYNHGSLEIRTVTDEYLIAMKMVSSREYRNDLSDIVGILAYSKKNGVTISYEKIIKAVEFLYGDVTPNEKVRTKVKEYAEMDENALSRLYDDIRNEENTVKEELIDIEGNYPGVVNENSVNDIIETIKKKILR